MLDADLQDQPELIPKMLAEWENGADVVYMVRAERQGETAFKLATARWTPCCRWESATGSCAG